jgi:hypothetical protein
MCVRVNKARRYDMALGVDFFFTGSKILADGGDLFTIDGDVRLKPRTSGSIDHCSILDD